MHVLPYTQCKRRVREVGYESSFDGGLQRSRAHGRSLASRDLTQVIVSRYFS